MAVAGVVLENAADMAKAFPEPVAQPRRGPPGNREECDKLLLSTFLWWRFVTLLFGCGLTRLIRAQARRIGRRHSTWIAFSPPAHVAGTAPRRLGSHPEVIGGTGPTQAGRTMAPRPAPAAAPRQPAPDVIAPPERDPRHNRCPGPAGSSQHSNGGRDPPAPRQRSQPPGRAVRPPGRREALTGRRPQAPPRIHIHQTGEVDDRPNNHRLSRRQLQHRGGCASVHRSSQAVGMSYAIGTRRFIMFSVGARRPPQWRTAAGWTASSRHGARPDAGYYVDLMGGELCHAEVCSAGPRRLAAVHDNLRSSRSSGPGRPFARSRRQTGWPTR
jgi:hypothetical protein